jgi:hypothetical protein
MHLPMTRSRRISQLLHDAARAAALAAASQGMNEPAR